MHASRLSAHSRVDSFGCCAPADESARRSASSHHAVSQEARRKFSPAFSCLNFGAKRSQRCECVASQMNINRAHVPCGRSGRNEWDASSMALRFAKFTDFNIRSGYLCSIHHRDVRQRLGSIILISSHPARRRSGRKSPLSERNIRKLMDSANRETSETDLMPVIRNAE